MSVLATSELDQLPTEIISKEPTNKRSAPSSSDEEEPTKKQNTRETPKHELGRLYFKNPENCHMVEQGKNGQFDFLSQSGRRFAFYTPKIKALCKNLREGGNLGKGLSFVENESQATINARLILETKGHENDPKSMAKARVHTEFKDFIENLEHTLMEKMWDSDSVRSKMLSNAQDILNLPEGKTEEEKNQRTQKLEKVAKQLFEKQFSHCLKPGNEEGEFFLNVKTKAYYPDNGAYKAQNIDYFNDQLYKQPEDFVMPACAMIGLVCKPSGYVTPNCKNYGLTMRMAWEVVMFEALGSQASTKKREDLFDTSRPLKCIVKTNGDGDKNVYVKDTNNSDYTWITKEAKTHWNFESNNGKFNNDESTSKYEGHLILSEENLQFVQQACDEISDFVLKDDTLLPEIKEKLKATAEAVEQPLESLWKASFQNPIKTKDGVTTVKVSKKEFYMNKMTKQYERQPFPIIDSNDDPTDDDRIARGSIVEVPLSFKVYLMNTGIYGVKLDLQTRYPTKVVQNASIGEGCPPPPSFDF